MNLVDVLKNYDIFSDEEKNEATKYLMRFD